MCLAVPAKIVALNGAEATVEISGIQRAANVALIDEPRVGDYVLLHAGFAIKKWTQADVDEFRALMADVEAAEATPDTARRAT